MAVLLTVTPVGLERDGLLLKLSADAAIAKNGNNGGGKGGEKGEASSKGDKGQAGGKAKKDQASKAGRVVSSMSRGVKRKGRGNVELVYPEGFREEISNGRYVMRDAQGRTIISRRATDGDRSRLGQH